jgi:hypothetical protein
MGLCGLGHGGIVRRWSSPLVRTRLRSLPVPSDAPQPAASSTRPADADVIAARDASAGVPDARTLMAEIEAEVRAKRRSGEIPESLERELEGAFDAVAPPGATGAGFDTVVDQAARHAIVDYDVAIVGSRPLRFLKRAVKTLTAWYLIYVGRQLVAFAGTTLRALRILGGRVDALEQRSPATDPRALSTRSPADLDDVSAWADVCVGALRGASGRVVHAECGNGALLDALAAAGIDAYGVDPRTDAAGISDAHRVEARTEDALEHLRSVSADGLGGIVLSGCVDRLVLGDKIELVEQAVRTVVSGGTVIVIGRDPRATVGERDEIAADLAPGGPMRAITWAHLLGRAGCLDVATHAGSIALPPELVDARDPALRALAERVCAPRDYAVVARRP